MKTLSIETSCDDTSLALVSEQDGAFVCDILLTDTQKFHDNYGGVVPEMASRAHSERIIPLFDRFLHSLGWTAHDFSEQVDCISVTVTPGLPGSLIIGKTFAHLLSQWYNKPLIEVNHLYGHVLSILLDRNINDIQFPLVVLSASGGHSDLYVVRHKQVEDIDGVVGDYTITKLGGTRDDAAGEAFDKVARMLGGPYPGGRRIGEMAEQHGVTSPQRSPYFLKRTLLEEGSFDFSFSGMKSQVYNFIAKHEQGKEHTEDLKHSLSEAQVAEIAYEFQEAITDVLISKLFAALKVAGAKTLGLVGGVSANKRLREKLHERITAVEILMPTKFDYCTDNAAMIGVVGLLSATSSYL